MDFPTAGLSIVAFILGLLAAYDVREIRRRARARRKCAEMRHLTGAPPWWGKR